MNPQASARNKLAGDTHLEERAVALALEVPLADGGGWSVVRKPRHYGVMTPWSGLGTTGILVRPAFRQLYDHFLPHIRDRGSCSNMLLLGLPGIGKTAFGV